MKQRTREPTRGSPRILLFDIETSPSLGWFWDLYETNIIETEQEWFIMSVAAKWLGEKHIYIYALPDFPQYRKDKTNDFYLMQALHKLISQADVIVAHNGDQFDIKKMNARLIAHNFPPPPPHKTVDTLKIARRHFKFNSNKLDELGRYFRIGRKLPTTGKHLWLSCMKGDMKSWARMKAYNKQDIILLEQVYLKLRPWASTHPDLRMYDGRPGCPVCKSPNIQRRGQFKGGRVKVLTYQRWQCMSCGKWFQGSFIK